MHHHALPLQRYQGYRAYWHVSAVFANDAVRVSLQAKPVDVLIDGRI
jgi:hypothetical protein